MHYEDYKKLKYKYSGNETEYRAMISQRLDKSVKLPLTAKDGQAMRFVMNEEIQSLLDEINKVYKDCEVDSITFVAEESLASCTIEGAKSTLPETIKLVEGKVPESKSEKMIQGNIKAIESVLQDGFVFTEDNIFKLWQAVANDAIDNESIKGDRYRIGDVVVADGMGNISYQAPDCSLVEWLMQQLVDFCNTDDNIDPYIKAVIIHYGFVYILKRELYDNAWLYEQIGAARGTGQETHLPGCFYSGSTKSFISKCS